MLRNLLSILALVLLGSATVFGQVSVGVKGSFQVSNLPNSDIKFDNLTGFQAGLMLKAPLSDQVSVRPQLLYSVKGGQLSGNGASAKLAINYLEVPIQLAYSIEAGNGNVVLGAGPYIGYALSAQTTSTVAGQTKTESADLSASDAPKRIDFGLHISGGYELSSGLSISAYFSPGLANLEKNSSGGSSTKTTAFGVSLGYFFGGN